MDFILRLFGWKRWTVIDDCPPYIFKARLKYDNGKIKYKKVYVHVDKHFLAWKDIRLKNDKSKIKFKVTHWK